MSKKIKLFLNQKLYLSEYKVNKINKMLVLSLQNNFEINPLHRVGSFIQSRKTTVWKSQQTTICPYTFTSKVPNSKLLFSRFYYTRYTKLLANSNLRQL